MATTPNLGITLPEQTTAPPDVVTWLSNVTNALDTILGTGSKSIVVATGTANGHPLRRDQILYGPSASVPATLPVGTLYCGY